MESKTISFDVFESYEWDKGQQKYIGKGKVDSGTETWKYDKSGNKSSETHLSSELKNAN